MHKKKQIGSKKVRICFVTEVDLDEIGGAPINDLKTLHSLRRIGHVDTIYLQKTRYKSMWLALPLFIFHILKSMPKPYSVYFSRGLTTTFFLATFRFLHQKKVIHQALSVPLPSSEVAFLTHFSKFELFLRYHLFRFLEKAVFSYVDVITVAADTYAQELCKIGVDENKIRVVHFYVEEDFFKQPVKCNMNGPFTFCYVGRFHLYHDLVLLIDAFKLLSTSESDIQLLLVGDGPQRPIVQRKIYEENLEGKIKLFGKLPHKSLPSLLSAVDCFVLLTRASGIPISLLEAAAAGKPIITIKRDSDSTLEQYFMHMKGIYIVSKASATELEKAMKLLYMDSKLRNKLAREARKVTRRYFHEEVVLQQLATLI